MTIHSVRREHKSGLTLNLVLDVAEINDSKPSALVHYHKYMLVTEIVRRQARTHLLVKSIAGNPVDENKESIKHVDGPIDLSLKPRGSS